VKEKEVILEDMSKRMKKVSERVYGSYFSSEHDESLRFLCFKMAVVRVIDAMKRSGKII
jgi:glutamate dehydrogenase (NAD(P)+)